MALFTFKRPSGSDSTQQRLLFQAIGLVILIGLTFSAVLFSSWKTSLEAQKLTATTQAQIIDAEPYNHALVKYEYSVSGRRYTGKQAEAGAYIVGSWQPVVYDPGNPSFCKLGDKPQPGNFTKSLCVSAALFALFTLCIIIAYGVKLRQLHAASRE